MKQFLVKALAILNFVEGAVHIITALISFWGIYNANVWDWCIAASPTADLFLGAVSLITSIVLGKWFK